MDKEKNGPRCPVEYAMSLIGGKWKIRILWSLSLKGKLRYGALRRMVYGITDMMLSQSLHELVRAGLIKRAQFSEIPPKVEYSLTGEGKALIPALGAVAQWAKIRMDKEGLAYFK